ncbi:VanZ family protein [Marinisporobacter balticus]|uniref:VanZ like protein n=1 Tax=Marinisporobacter balticus TaxID=2018667 RepID=A0A4R2KV51_9FIRM|nr:VanZ family protein [Marinisporobacter balticus]TCO75039.1 VanZ like protein [Marinisporobacter balticus]
MKIFEYKKIFFILFLGYVFYLFYLVFFSDYYGRGSNQTSYNLILFNTIIEYLSFKHSIKNIMVNIGGNILAFVPFGFFLPLVFKKANSYMKVLIGSFTLTCFIEMMQYIFDVGTCDIDDVLLNVMGGLLGYIFIDQLWITKRR